MRVRARELNRTAADRIAALDGVIESASMFRDGDAYWAHGKEIAHFEGDGVIEIRLTKAVIRERRSALKADPRVELRRSGADWITVAFRSESDVGFVVDLVEVAEAAHRHGAAAGAPPPTGADLERRRRFH